MYIVRTTFTTKPGQASKMAQLFKQAFTKDRTTRVMTDYIGDFNTVVMETEVESISDYERQMEEYKTGKLDLTPELAEQLSNYTEMYLTGRREIFKVID